MNREEVLLEIAHRLEAKYGVVPSIFHEKGYVLIEDASKPDGPIDPADIETIIREVAKQFNLKFTELVYSINYGDIQVGLADK